MASNRGLGVHMEVSGWIWDIFWKQRQMMIKRTSTVKDESQTDTSIFLEA